MQDEPTGPRGSPMPRSQVVLHTRVKCEVCGRSDVKLLQCASTDQAALDFCPEHYIEHVYGAHDGRPLPGCSTLVQARRLAEKD